MSTTGPEESSPNEAPPAAADAVLNSSSSEVAVDLNDVCVCFPVDRHFRDLLEYLMLMMFAFCFGFFMGVILARIPCQC